MKRIVRTRPRKKQIINTEARKIHENAAPKSNLGRNIGGKKGGKYGQTKREKNEIKKRENVCGNTATKRSLGRNLGDEDKQNIDK